MAYAIVLTPLTVTLAQADKECSTSVIPVVYAQRHAVRVSYEEEVEMYRQSSKAEASITMC